MNIDILPGTWVCRSIVVVMVLGGDGETEAQNYTVEEEGAHDYDIACAFHLLMCQWLSTVSSLA